MIGILENGFYPRFCLEKFSFEPRRPSEFSIPMISFCDIPLSQIKNHVRRYGPYGLGLTKQWATTKGMNPVLYIKENSLISTSIRDFLDILKLIKDSQEKLSRKTATIKTNTSTRSALIVQFKKAKLIERELESLQKIMDGYVRFLMYLKQYEGYSLKESQKKVKIRFYDEREWRYIPNLKPYNTTLNALDIPITGILTKQHLADPVTKSKANALLESVKLHFNPTDIKYIIVKREDEILKMITKLEHIKGDKYPSNIIKILTSRILTYEQIDKDL